MNTTPWPYPLAGVFVEVSALAALPVGYTWYFAYSFGDHVLAFGTSGSNWVSAKLSALDGAWTLGTPVNDSVLVASKPVACARRSGGQYLIRRDDTTLYSSGDGLAWSLVVPDWSTVNTPFYYTPGAVGDTFYVLAEAFSSGWELRILSSPNGANWTLLDAEATSEWQVTGQPVALGDGLYLPVGTTAAAASGNPPCLFGGGALAIGEHRYPDGSYASAFANDPPYYADATFGVVGGYIVAGALRLGYKASAAARVVADVSLFTDNPSSQSSAGWSSEGFFAFERVDGAQTSAALLADDGEGGLVGRLMVSNAPYASAGSLGAWLSGVSTLHSASLGTGAYAAPMNDTPLLLGFDGAGSLKLAAANTTHVEAGAPLRVPALPASVTGIVAVTQSDFSYYSKYLSNPVGQAIFREGAAVLQIAVPPGTRSITMQFPLNTNPDVYADIFAAQGKTYVELMEQYDNPDIYYGWTDVSDPEMMTQTIPVSGEEDLVVVFQLYDADGQDGRALDVIFTANAFWTGLTGCREV